MLPEVRSLRFRGEARPAADLGSVLPFERVLRAGKSMVDCRDVQLFLVRGISPKLSL